MLEINKCLYSSQLKKNDDFLIKEWREKHSSQWRLTDKGRKQAQAAGVWLKENFSKDMCFKFDSYYTSEYVRAVESAALLGLENADWNVDFHLRYVTMRVVSNVQTI